MHDKKARPTGAAAARSEKTWERKRPRGRSATKAQSLDLAVRLIDDPRIRQLTPTGRYAMTVAAAKYADRDGSFYVKQETLAVDVGTSRQTINDVLDSAESLGLIEQTHFLRHEQRGQGASNYRFDPTLTVDFPGVVNSDTQVISAVKDDTRQGVGKDDTREGVGKDDTVNESSNEDQSNDGGDGPISSRIDDLLAPLPNFKRTPENLALIADGLKHNEPLVFHLRDRAFNESDRPNPCGLFLYKLGKAQHQHWKSRDVPRQPTPAELFDSAVKMCQLYDGDEYEIADWVKRGVDETQLRDALKQADPPKTAAVVSELFPIPPSRTRGSPMPRETVTGKAARLLADRRLHVTHVDGDHVEAVCHGDHGTYRLGHRNGRWTCSCPARIECAHLIALARVTAPQPK